MTPNQKAVLFAFVWCIGWTWLCKLAQDKAIDREMRNRNDSGDET